MSDDTKREGDGLRGMLATPGAQREFYRGRLIAAEATIADLRAALERVEGEAKAASDTNLIDLLRKHGTAAQRHGSASREAGSAADSILVQMALRASESERASRRATEAESQRDELRREVEAVRHEAALCAAPSKESISCVSSEFDRGVLTGQRGAGRLILAALDRGDDDGPDPTQAEYPVTGHDHLKIS